jgi:hypothetical protein
MSETYNTWFSLSLIATKTYDLEFNSILKTPCIIWDCCQLPIRNREQGDYSQNIGSQFHLNMAENCEDFVAMRSSMMMRFLCYWSGHQFLLTSAILFLIRVVKAVIITVTDPCLGYAALIVTCKVPGVGTGLNWRLGTGVCLTGLVLRFH